jgi:putative transposase
MSKLRRYFQEGDFCFITCVTYQRYPLLVQNIDFLRNALDKAIEHAETELIAWVVLPDHFHALLYSGTTTVTQIVHRLKLSFSANYRKRNNLHSGRIWQNRFWDHIIRSQDDFNRHIDYIHINPVKHGLVQLPVDYPHSSFNDYMMNGYYDSDWCIIDVKQLEGDYGE